MTGRPDENRQLERTKPGKLSGSALGVFPLDVLQLKYKQRLGDSEGGSEKFRENRDTDYVRAEKYADPLMGITYLASGTISVAESSGEFVFTNSGNKPTSGALYLNQVKSEFTSTASTTKVGTPYIKTLTGLLLNPASVRRPSSTITPERGWMASLFPALSRFNTADWAMVSAVQALFWESLSLIFQGEDDPTSSTVRRDRKDLGTLIVDNQDFEQMILNGDI